MASAPDEKEFRALALLVRGSGEPTGMEAWCERCRQHPRYANCLRCRRNICRGCTKIAFQGATYCFPCWHKIAPDDGLVIDALSMGVCAGDHPSLAGLAAVWRLTVQHFRLMMLFLSATGLKEVSGRRGVSESAGASVPLGMRSASCSCLTHSRGTTVGGPSTITVWWKVWTQG